MATVRYMLHTSAEKTMTIVETPTVPSTAAPAQRSPWHSPVPYLFGGLAAMLGLIAFALLILACSYWRLSGYLEGGPNNERDPEAGEPNVDDSDGAQKKAPQFLVIMPGQEKPTCLATPMSSRASSFGSTSNSSSSSSCSSETSEKSEGENEQKKQENGVQLQMVSMAMETTPHETAAAAAAAENQVQ